MHFLIFHGVAILVSEMQKSQRRSNLVNSVVDRQILLNFSLVEGFDEAKFMNSSCIILAVFDKFVYVNGC